MKALRSLWRTLFAAALMIVLMPGIMEAKKPVFKNSVWVNRQEMFVADVGTMTITHTLEFGSGKEVKLKSVSFMPAHPASYMNPDGTVDRIPARSSEIVQEGTWMYKRGKLIITLQDGSQEVYSYQHGMLLGEKGSQKAYSRQ